MKPNRAARRVNKKNLILTEDTRQIIQVDKCDIKWVKQFKWYTCEDGSIIAPVIFKPTGELCLLCLADMVYARHHLDFDPYDCKPITKKNWLEDFKRAGLAEEISYDERGIGTLINQRDELALQLIEANGTAAKELQRQLEIVDAQLEFFEDTSAICLKVSH